MLNRDGLVVFVFFRIIIAYVISNLLIDLVRIIEVQEFHVIGFNVGLNWKFLVIQECLHLALLLILCYFFSLKEGQEVVNILVIVLISQNVS